MNKKPLDINEIDLKKLKKFLQHGDITKISHKTGYSINYVSRVLNPEDKRINRTIIQEAIRLAEKSNEIMIDPKFAKNISH